jgi:GAF domain-containing protein
VLEQQAATAEILSVISSSPTDAQPVLDTVAATAARLCEAFNAVIRLRHGDELRLAAHYGPIPAVDTISIVPGLVAGRAVLERRTVHIPDVWAATEEFPEARENARRLGWRTQLTVPLLKEETAIGTIAIRRPEVRPFTHQQIGLLQTFAKQAVIAIENVRLFTEATHSLDRQTATSEILRVIASSPADLQPVLDAIAERTARLCDSFDGSIYRVDGTSLRLIARKGLIAEATHARLPDVPLVRGTVNGRAVIERRTIHIADLQAEMQEYPEGSARARQIGWRTQLSVPLLREGAAIGVMAVRRLEVRPFTGEQIALVETFADQAVIAIENVRLFKETQEALDRQTATSEILGVISSSPTDLQPVFDTIVENAARLCGADDALLQRVDGEVLRVTAHVGSLPSTWTDMPIIPDLVVGRAVLERRTFHIHDMVEEHARGNYPASVDHRRQVGYRTLLVTPLIRENLTLGAIVMRRLEVRDFTKSQIDLLQTFADQAVIAIENVRLFTELQARTQQLTRSVEQLTALREVGHAVSSSLDLETVLNTIVARAVQLAGAHSGTMWEYNASAGEFVLRITQNVEDPELRANPNARVRRGEGAVGRLAVSQRPVQIPDITHEGAYEGRLRDSLVGAGNRALLAIPLLHEDQLLGGLVISRRTPGEFPAEVVDLLASFATQSALALQNARLFLEIENKSRQLEAASQHKSEFLANMSHELRTPLNAIIGFSEVLSERMFGELNEKQEEYLKDIYASGQHLLSLINDILDLSKIEAGRMELEVSDFDLPTALDNALTLVRERAGRRGIGLHMNVDSRLGQIQAEERKIRQVVLNLLSNAIKFTREGGRIEVLAVPKNGLVEVSVVDTGVGIAPEDQEAVFEEFRQVGTADKKWRARAWGSPCVGSS